MVGNKWWIVWNCRPPCIQSSQAGQSTSIVVRNCCKAHGSLRLGVMVDMAKWERVNWTCNGMVTMCEIIRKRNRCVHVGIEHHMIRYPNQNQ